MKTNSIIITKTYDEPDFCEKEILRYAGCREPDDKTLDLIRSCIDEVKGKLSYKVCYRELDVSVTDSLCYFGCVAFESENLAQNLKGCQEAILFAATIGVEIDRLIAKYGRISPSRALVMQAIGAERIEALCDAFCEDIAKKKNAVLRPRFSPGYGDLPVFIQQEIFTMLDCPKRIGLCLSDSMLMTPSKSVTAFVGLGSDIKNKTDKCSSCDKTDCSYRGAL